MNSPLPQKTMVITGCSSGFGRATALRMARLGWRVFATVRKEADQAALREEAARLGYQDRLLPVLCEITDAAQVAGLRDVVSGSVEGLDALMNNAGTAFAAPLELLDLDDLRQQFEINVVAHVSVTQTFLPLLRAAQGTIINISSVSGRYSAPVVGPYAASKYALEALSDALRVEVAHFGVKVVLVEPGSSSTHIWATSRQHAEKLNKYRAGPYGPLLARVEQFTNQAEKHGFAPELVAETIEQILSTARPKTRYLVPKKEGRVIFLRKFISDRQWDKQMRKVMQW
ncbi:MAG TPA: SDR family NAD(P)-dependent oxidoreductase [Ktedonobacteraceae bacterium]